MSIREFPRAIRLDLSSEAETQRLAKLFSAHSEAGMTLLLEGPIGAGKTTFARALIHSLLDKIGQREDVPSPTFTLVQTYNTGPFDTWHADLYRLGSSSEVFDLGLDIAFEEALCIIEWPDRLGDLTPVDAIKIELSLSDDDQGRSCLISGVNNRNALTSKLQCWDAA